MQSADAMPKNKKTGSANHPKRSLSNAQQIPNAKKPATKIPVNTTATTLKSTTDQCPPTLETINNNSHEPQAANPATETTTSEPEAMEVQPTTSNTTTEVNTSAEANKNTNKSKYDYSYERKSVFCCKCKSENTCSRTRTVRSRHKKLLRHFFRTGGRRRWRVRVRYRL